MTSGVEITAPITVTLDQPGPSGKKFYTAYPFSHKFVKQEVLPYMARAHSPVRVSLTPSALAMKRKSRVTDTAKNAIFNYKPLRRGNYSSVLKFRAPDATLPTLQYLSPWISVTKTDYQDPRFSGDLTNYTEVTPGLFGRSYTDTSIDISRRNTSTISRSESLRKSEISSQQRPKGNHTRETSAKTVSSIGKRVKILDPAEDGEFENGISETVTKPVSSSASSSVTAKVMEIKEPESGVNYYSGYLPPELSDKIAEKLKISVDHSAHEDSDKKGGRHFLPAQFYKPLVGDRTLYMHGSYPAQPNILRSDIDQLRLEGRKRFLQSNGQIPVHFSALKNRGTLVRPKQKGARLDEAVREQQRQTQSAKISKQPGQATSLEVFQQQRERTYHLQKLAREMINK